MQAKYPGKCARCGVTIPKGALCAYDVTTKTISHFNCGVDTSEARNDTTEDAALLLAERLGFHDFKDLENT